MGPEPDQAGAQSHPNPQCQAHPIPLYESNNYIYYVEVLQSLQWLLLYPWANQHLIHCKNQLCDWPHNGLMCMVNILCFLSASIVIIYIPSRLSNYYPKDYYHINCSNYQKLSSLDFVSLVFKF